LTKTQTRDGPAHVWTTFSSDQIDLNWQNPDVLFEFIDILLLYLSKGCTVFRLDAVAFLWKEVGTSCLHLPETHEVVKLFRDILNWVSPGSILLTETNVPHDENVSYFGNNDEAHMVYNFSLPPLLLYSLLRGDATLLSEWAGSLPDLSPQQSFFNFTASHDGIGVRPLQGLLANEELNWLVRQVKGRGGRVSEKANSDGSTSPYELNITYRDALTVPGDPEKSLSRYLLSQAVVLAFKGVPAVYIHSLVGTENDIEGLQETGENRSINRRKWDLDQLSSELDDPSTSHARIYLKISAWIRIRNQHVAFHPGASMQVVSLGPDIFAFVRTSRKGAEKILCLYNMTAEEKGIPWSDCFQGTRKCKQLRELLSGEVLTPVDDQLRLPALHAHWLMISGDGSRKK
jgi:sucrose phosphorylase